MPPELETEDFEAVELIRADVRHWGIGSPTEGDVYSRRDLEAMVEASTERGGRRPVKLGHSTEQRLARASGFPVSDDAPGLGWLENLRVDGDSLVGDLKAVPRKLASLIKAGAFRRRSVEMRKLAKGWAITGLSLQGARAPALDTLDDIVKLYGDDEPDGEMRTADVDVEGASGEIPEGRFALLSEDETLVSAQRLGELEEAERKIKARADIETVDDLTLNEEAQRKLAEQLGLEGDEIDGAKLLEAAEARATELAEAKTKVEEAESKQRQLEETDAGEAAKKLEDAEERIRKLEEERRCEKRDVLIDGAVTDGRIEPGQKEAWQKDYDEAPEVTTRHLEALDPDENLVRELGRALSEEEAEEAEDERYAEDASERLGVEKEAVI